MTESDDIDMLAAEYVLGTLDADERMAVERRCLNEPEFRHAIAAWTERLAPLDGYIEAVAPRSEVRAATRARIAALVEQRAGERNRSQGTADNVTALRRSIGRWRAAAVGATAMAAAFAGLFFFSGQMTPFAPQSYVAVFNEGDQQPAFVLSIDLQTRELTIRPVNAGQLADKTYELWIVSDDISLRSLGLLGSGARPARKQLEAFGPEALQKATFGISVEPIGGSPTGRPTGPAMHGKLIDATN
jgi:anti-sigma-K factor RskA